MELFINGANELAKNNTKRC